MHCLKICHIDIKPANIMYSHSFKKTVMIDFGMSELLKDDHNHLLLTSFPGSYNYASPPMLRLLQCHKIGYVNFYFNDIISNLSVSDIWQIGTIYQFCYICGNLSVFQYFSLLHVFAIIYRSLHFFPWSFIALPFFLVSFSLIICGAMLQVLFFNL